MRQRSRVVLYLRSSAFIGGFNVLVVALPRRDFVIFFN
jgi:hypothetical protein